MKTIIITGAASGIGKSTARLLASQGNNVVLLDMNAEGVKKVEEEFKAENLSVASFVANITSLEDMKNAAAFTLKTFGKIDVLVNVAGIMPVSLLRDLLVDEWDAMIDVNIKGVLNGIAAVLPIMREQKSGHIITISSLAGLKVGKTTSVYSATKTAVKIIMEGLRMEESPESGIRSTVVYPGNVNTNLVNTISVPAVKEANVKGLAQSQEPINIANAIAYAINTPEDVAISEIVVRPNCLPY
jgi:NADP-dependent 3-hydroxy acid dehydrogenase YdfG